MKFVLIIFAAFHTDGGAASQQLHFETMSKCEAARVAIINAHESERAWGRRSITAVCVAI